MSTIRSRREFLKILAAGTCGGIAHQLLAPANGFLAYADPLAANINGVFVLFNFAGGVSYNLTPVYNSQYRARNPNISFSESESIVLNSTQGLHPALTSLQPIWNDGQLAVLNLIGAGPGHSRSHDEATKQWHTGISGSMNAAVGWGAKLTSQLQSAFGGISFSGTNDLVRGGSNPPRVLSSLSSLGENRVFYSTDDSLQLQIARTNLVAQGNTPTNPSHEHTRESIIQLQSNIELLRQYANMTLPVSFPNTSLGRKFADAARLIAAGPALNVKLIYIEQGGYDTHSDERTVLTNNLTQFNAAVGAFISCMKAMNKWDDVVIANMSEFTRTMENSSMGTDHGLAGPQLILGGKVKGGQKTPAPTATEIANREFIRETHGTFAQVFSEIVQEFLGLDSSTIFNGDISASPYFDVI
jgi:uncharacterized protein (DUF1501 family)